MNLTATSSNSWFHHLLTTTCRSHAGIILLRTTIRIPRWASQYEPQFVFIIRLPTSLALTRKRKSSETKLYKSQLARSHRNSNYHQATTWNDHMFNSSLQATTRKWPPIKSSAQGLHPKLCKISQHNPSLHAELPGANLESLGEISLQTAWRAPHTAKHHTSRSPFLIVGLSIINLTILYYS